MEELANFVNEQSKKAGGIESLTDMEKDSALMGKKICEEHFLDKYEVGMEEFEFICTVAPILMTAFQKLAEDCSEDVLEALKKKAELDNIVSKEFLNGERQALQLTHGIIAGFFAEITSKVMKEHPKEAMEVMKKLVEDERL